MPKTMTEKQLTILIDASAFEACTALSQVLDAYQTIQRLQKEMVEELPRIDPCSLAGKRAEQFALLLTRTQGRLAQAAAFMPDDVWLQFVGHARPERAQQTVGPDEFAESFGDMPRVPALAG
jgi:hypothetical protein